MKLMSIMLALAVSCVCSIQGMRSDPKARPAEREMSSKLALASKQEPGERLIVSGAVYARDGATPVEGAIIYVYQTDIKGYYSAGGADERNPRLRGWMRTGKDGRYEFQTVKPGPYPGNRIPAHIHYVVSKPGYVERRFEILFEGDPLISDEQRARAEQEDSPFSIRPLNRDAHGALRCAQDIKLRREQPEPLTKNFFLDLL